MPECNQRLNEVLEMNQKKNKGVTTAFYDVFTSEGQLYGFCSYDATQGVKGNYIYIQPDRLRGCLVQKPMHVGKELSSLSVAVLLTSTVCFELNA